MKKTGRTGLARIKRYWSIYVNKDAILYYTPPLPSYQFHQKDTITCSNKESHEVSFRFYKFSLYHWIASLIPFSKSYSGA